MKREIALKWAEALESGKYPQGKGALCKLDGDGNKRYCCLGVLCELAIDDGVEIEVVPTGTNSVLKYAGSIVNLPEVVAKWAGDSVNPVLSDHRSAIQLNDGMGKSFAEIAALIRARWVA